MNQIRIRVLGLKSHWVLAIPVVVVLVGAWMHHWVAEDAFIDFRVIRNMLAGHGPVFNVGQRVEVYTDPLWVAVLAIVSFVLPFFGVEWWSVILGLAFTAIGFVSASAAAFRLSARFRQQGERVLPLGLLVVSCVAVVWDFSTSGLETGMIFGWIGLSWLLLVKTFNGESSARRAALVASLGFTIRPDMAPITVVLVAALWLVERSANPLWSRRRAAMLVFYGAAVPILSELFRVAYFGLLTSNTAIAKSGTRLWLSQGWAYLWNFLSTYWLLVPLVGAVVLVAPLWQRLWREGERLRLVVMVAPAIGGLIDALYVTAIGGDFMHGRMYLPTFFACGAVTWCVVPRRTLGRVVVGVLAVWGLWSVSMARYAPSHGIAPSGIANERSTWANWAQNANPVTLTDYHNWMSLKELSLSTETQSLSEIVASSVSLKRPHLLIDHQLLVMPRSAYPSRLFIVEDNVGILGFSVPSDVFVIDHLALASPVNSHFDVPVRTRPGHEKQGSPPWTLGQFAPGYRHYNDFYFKGQVSEASRAMACWPLSGYLNNISGHLSATVIWRNLTHAVTWTTMSFSADPTVAQRELCGSN